jgi:hypothetical protein
MQIFMLNHMGPQEPRFCMCLGLPTNACMHWSAQVLKLPGPFVGALCLHTRTEPRVVHELGRDRGS